MKKNFDVLNGEMLQSLFPYQFNKPNIGFGFYRGWMPIIAGLCIELDRILGDDRELFHWRQIKEKFGSARLYYSFAEQTLLRVDIHSPDGVQSLRQQPVERSDLGKAVDQLIAEAEKATCSACLICGDYAETRSYGGFHITVCDRHHPEKIRRPEDLGWEALWELAEPLRPGGRAT